MMTYLKKNDAIINIVNNQEINIIYTHDYHLTVNTRKISTFTYFSKNTMVLFSL